MKVAANNTEYKGPFERGFTEPMHGTSGEQALYDNSINEHKPSECLSKEERLEKLEVLEGFMKEKNDLLMKALQGSFLEEASKMIQQERSFLDKGFLSAEFTDCGDFNYFNGEVTRILEEAGVIVEEVDSEQEDSA